MLSWLGGLLGRAGSAVSSAISSFVNGVVSALAAIVDFVFRDVLNAWNDLVTSWKEFDAAVDTWIPEVIRLFTRILTVDIPRYAYTAWWWATHPDQLASVLYWHLVHYLEARAWATAQYLGEFILALIAKNTRRVALLIEDILHAII